MLKRRIQTDAVPPVSSQLQHLHRPREVAQLLSVAESTLRAWRRRGKGPEFVVCARNVIRYPKDALMRWVEGRADRGGPTGA